MNDYISHHGIKGQKWGIRRFQNPDGTRTALGRQREGQSSPKVQRALSPFRERMTNLGYKALAVTRPKEFKYAVKKILNNPDQDTKSIAKHTTDLAVSTGVLPLNSVMSNAIEKVGIEKHKQATYDMDDSDLDKLKKYTNAAWYSRQVNSYLAIGEPKHFEDKAKDLKKTLSKASVDDTVVFRSCALKFSFNGIAKKLDTMSEEELKKSFDNFSKNYKGKTFKENRVFSTSTSPNFAIDTWRKVNPNAAANYNTYMIIKTENCPGVLADGKTKSGKALVNTRSNQEGILAPNKMRYESLKYDEERSMFAITVTAQG